jgi:hypothetical protein
MEIDRDVFARRNAADQLGLVAFAQTFEMGDRLVARPHFAPRRQVRRDDFVHLRFNLREIVRGKRRIARKIVIEAVVDRGANGDLRAGIKRLDRHGQNMGGIVPDHFQRFDVLAGNDPQSHVVLDRPENIPGVAVHLDRQRRFGEAGADHGRDFRTGCAARDRHRLAVGQGYDHLGRRRMRRRHWLSPVS